MNEQLAQFLGMLNGHATLQKVLVNPAVPAPRKRDAVAAIVAITSPHPILGRLFVLLAERDRLVLLPELVDAYRDRLRQAQGVVRAEVTTATALSADQARAIEHSLAVATGSTIDLATRVDPSLVGGLVARLGSTVYDGSVASQLRRMRRRLLQAGG